MAAMLAVIVLLISSVAAAAARPAPDALEQVLLQASMEVGAGQDGEESDPCVDSVVTFQQHLTLDNVLEDEMPVMIEGWCQSVVRQRRELLPSGATERICQHGRVVFQEYLRRPEFATPERKAKVFCATMREGFEAEARKYAAEHKREHKPWAFERPMATHADDVVADAESGVRRPCCAPHDAQACVDEAISECVCKVDRFCCESNWDLRCAEMVETTKCGRCPTASAASA